MTNRERHSSILPASAIIVRAPAKTNLILRVLDRRADGFHNLWSVMQTVGLEDDITIRLNQDHGDLRLHCDVASLSTDQTNLVIRAAAAVLRRCERTLGMDIALTKRIPMGAGLGGGSSDAAATIIGLNRLLNLGWSAMEMAQVGQALGSDVPFFFFAPSAVVTGRGEHVSPVRMKGSRWIVLVNPGFSVETKWAYQELSSSRTHVPALSDQQAALDREHEMSWEQIMQAAENDFETPVFAAHPDLRAIKRDLVTQGAEAALLSGSGATVFGVFRDEARAKQAHAYFQPRPRYRVFVVATASGPLIANP
ncbi:MAG: 4-(cytidine 5'-diphospho)-2-C-methyl-D-erythritol kinase [Nitrospira sp.]|nr:4-(cytidine 5'-diphospho)-2-C-methyl-D-erythritol kinase [Nitrospira sp.]